MSAGDDLLLLRLTALTARRTDVHVAATLEARGATLLLGLDSVGALSLALSALVTAGLTCHVGIPLVGHTFRRRRN